MAMTPKQKKFAALAPPRNKITYADKIAGATKGKAKRGKAKIKAQKGKIPIMDQVKTAQKSYNNMLKMLASNVKLLDTLSPKQREELQLMFGKEKIKLKSKMKDTGLKTTPRRAGGLTAAVKKIKTGARRRGGTGRGR
jgi:GTP1/Obg family GTP-binding protein